MQRPKHRRRCGFALIELVVIVLVLLLLVTLTLPALATTRDQSLISVSKSNLRQLGMAHRMYAADHNDNQWTMLPHDIASYGSTPSSAFSGWCSALGAEGVESGTCVNGEPAIWLGYGTNEWGHTGTWHGISGLHDYNLFLPPIAFDMKPALGSYLLSHVQSFNRYVNGKVFDQTFFAPKHQDAVDAVGDCFDDPLEFCPIGSSVSIPTYSLSPAALFHPEVWNVPEGEFPGSISGFYQAHGFPNAFQTPTYSQARFPQLKTHMMESVWLQNNDQDEPCVDGPHGYPYNYDGCQQWLFNASIHSAPATLFYDGHVRLVPLSEVKAADEQISVWRKDTPYFGADGYFHQQGAAGPDNSELSHHILTNGGIKGRDTLGPITPAQQ